MKSTLAYLIILLTCIAFDAVWLGIVAKESYVTSMKGLMRESFPVWPWITFYPMYTLAISYLVITPAIEDGKNWSSVLIGGAILGMASYGAYNLTNYAIIKNWPLAITFKDWAWGIFMTGSSSLISWYLIKYFQLK